MKNIPAIKWLTAPEVHDYPAALSYLRLLYADAAASILVEKLKAAEATSFKAKDILRASQLVVLSFDNIHLTADLKKIKKKTSLSPILLVRDSANERVIIADGYHRTCAVYSLDEDIVIPCRII